MLSAKKIKRAAIVTAIVGVIVLILGHFMSDNWSDFFSGLIVGMGGTWVVAAAIYLASLFKKK